MTTSKTAETAPRARRGFAAMTPEKQREIASKGGRSAHEQGGAHEFTVDEAREAGRKGGQKVAADREHMREIGRRGGRAVSSDSKHMAEIGRLGGQSVAKNPDHMRAIGRIGGSARRAPRPEAAEGS